MKMLPNIGERLIVHGMTQKAVVDDVCWDDQVNSWKIILDWGEFGKSRVWSHDENRVWYRISTNN
jgi:hypothetical protein